MTTYTVHHGARNPRAVLADADRVQFVKEGVAWFALVLPFVWFIAHGLWLVLAGYLVFVFAMPVLADLAGLPDFAVTATGFAANILIGFEANNLRRWTLRRRGLPEIAVAEGRNLHEAERRYYAMLIEEAGREPSGPPPPGPPRPAPRPVRIAAEETPAALFPAPGGVG